MAKPPTSDIGRLRMNLAAAVRGHLATQQAWNGQARPQPHGGVLADHRAGTRIAPQLLAAYRPVEQRDDRRGFPVLCRRCRAARGPARSPPSITRERIVPADHPVRVGQSLTRFRCVLPVPVPPISTRPNAPNPRRLGTNHKPIRKNSHQVRILARRRAAQSLCIVYSRTDAPSYYAKESPMDF